MVTIVVVIHIVVCVSLVIVILLQQGKGAEVGAVFGGSSQTVFGATGAGGVLVKLTAGLATVFFLTSIFLAYSSTQRATGSIFEGNVAVPARPIGKTPPVSRSLPAAPVQPVSPGAPAPK